MTEKPPATEQPSAAPEQKRRPGWLTENGEPLRAPWEAQEFDVPPPRPPLAEPDMTGLKDALERYVKHILVDPEDVAEDVAALRESQERRDYLTKLQRWTPKTSNIQNIIATLETVVREYADKKKPAPEATRRRLRDCQTTLVLCLERDEIVTERAEAYPGCNCLGLGGYGEVAVCLRAPADPNVPHDSGKLLYIERDPMMTWSQFCDFCPDGKRERERERLEREALRRRWDASKAERRLGAAEIPEKYAGYQLESFPDLRLAARLGKWYVRNIEGSPPDERAPRIWLLLHGPNRRGKTTLAAGLANLALARGEPALWRSMKRILDEIKASYDKESKTCSSDVLQALYTAPFLIIDDLGAEHLTGWVEETIYGVFEERLNNGRLTVITSNLGWTDNVAETNTTRVTEAHAGDWNPEEMMDRVGERTWWRIRDGANQVPVIGPVLGIDDTPARRRLPEKKLEDW